MLTRRIYVLVVLVFNSNGSIGDRIYRMEDYCNGMFSFMSENIYQTKFQLTDDNIMDKADPNYPDLNLGYCEAIVEARNTYFAKLMFYFEDLDLDCHKGHLEFYFGEKSNSRVEGLSDNVCGKVKPEGVFKVDSRCFRIRYVPKSNQYTSDVFSLIITSFGDGWCPSYGYECGNSRCIHKNVACNGYNSCGDQTGCDPKIVGIVIGGIVGVGLVISLVVCCVYCSRRAICAPGTVQTAVTTTQMDPPACQSNNGLSQRSSHSTNMTTYSHALPPDAAILYFNQTNSTSQNYDTRQGTNHQTNHETYLLPPETDGHVDLSAPPPSYDEIITSSSRL